LGPASVAAALLVGAVLSGVGCQAKYDSPDLGGIYNRSARHHGPERNPVIVIPGVLGSRLIQQKTGKVVWGAYRGDYADPANPDDARLIALPMRGERSLGRLQDDVQPDGVLDQVKVSLFGLTISQRAYMHILGTLGAGGYRDQTLGQSGAVDYGSDHYTCFQFPYDWRLDNAANARRLHAFIQDKRRYVQQQRRKRYGVNNSDVQFDIVAHSMGGLIARYYLRYGDAKLPDDGSLPTLTWKGASNVEHVILVGTPNAGSARMLMTLKRGEQFGPFLPRYAPALLGTFSGLYQLLPRSRHNVVKRQRSDKAVGDLYSLSTWKEFDWGLADPAQSDVLAMLLPTVDDARERRRIALNFLERSLVRAKQFHRALDRPASPPESTKLYLFAGDAKATVTHLDVDAATGKLHVAQKEPGDGSVPRYSALMDERMGGSWQPRLRSPIDWDQVHLLFNDHLGLTRSPGFSDNVLYLLLEQPQTKPSAGDLQTAKE
jgi:pimeloyl-ACP methyl ester carboxylesterase